MYDLQTIKAMNAKQDTVPVKPTPRYECITQANMEFGATRQYGYLYIIQVPAVKCDHCDSIKVPARQVCTVYDRQAADMIIKTLEESGTPVFGIQAR